MSTDPVAVQKLGQSGFRFEARDTVIYVDPYLSDSVAEREGEHLRRLVPPPILPTEVTDADLVCITHTHLDHCDDATLGPISLASPQCRFFCPPEVANVLKEFVPAERIVLAREEWTDFGRNLRIRAIASAHPTVERDDGGDPRFVGFLFDLGDRKIYHSGDTSVSDEVREQLLALGPIDVAFLPVNECNFYRGRSGIIGNMSVREAFAFAAELGVRLLVPMHFDMFRPNIVYPDEIAVVYRGERPPFAIDLDPSII